MSDSKITFEEIASRPNAIVVNFLDFLPSGNIVVREGLGANELHKNRNLFFGNSIVAESANKTPQPDN